MLASRHAPSQLHAPHNKMTFSVYPIMTQLKLKASFYSSCSVSQLSSWSFLLVLYPSTNHSFSLASLQFEVMDSLFPLTKRGGGVEVCSKNPYCVIMWIRGAPDWLLLIPLCSMKQDFNILMHLKQFISSQFETAIYLGNWLWMEDSGKNGRICRGSEINRKCICESLDLFSEAGKSEKCWFKSQGISAGYRQQGRQCHGFSF